MRRAAAIFLLCGCARFSPVTISEALGTAGWFRADAEGRWRAVDPAATCAQLGASIGEGEVYVLVHGVKGDGDEVTRLLPVLDAARPAAVFLFRWVTFDTRDRIAGNFAAGVSHLLDCAPQLDGRLLVLAHSAGGVVVGFGVNRLRIPKRGRTGPALYVLTVASPLAGMNDRARNPGGREEARFVLDFGSAITEYPVAPIAAAVVHLRTQYPADPVMKPNAGRAPNDPLVGVPGARQVDLPAELTHDGALVYVAHKIADGTWRAFFAE